MAYTSLFLTFLVSFILLINYWPVNKGIIYLVVAILGVSIRQLISLLLNRNGDASVLATLYVNFDPFIILIGPSIFLYFKSVIKGEMVINYTLIFHLIPSFLVLLNTFPYYFVDFAEKVTFLEELLVEQNTLPNPFPYLIVSYPIQRLFMPMINLSYGFYTIYYVLKIKQSGTVYIKKKMDRILKHGITTVIIFFIFTLVFYLYLYLQDWLNFNSVVSEGLMKSFFYFYSLVIPICFFLFPSWLYGDKEGQNLLKRIIIALKIEFKPSLNNDEPNFNKSTDLDRILLYLEQYKPFLKENFSLHDLSIALNIPDVRVTHCFNKQLGTSFPIYRNKRRIEHATILLQEGAHVTTSIEGIASKSGFKSKTAFYTAFKAEYGLNPLEWIKGNV
jgi:AraC-like DNA-binding protein